MLLYYQDDFGTEGFLGLLGEGLEGSIFIGKNPWSYGGAKEEEVEICIESKYGNGSAVKTVVFNENKVNGSLGVTITDQVVSANGEIKQNINDTTFFIEF